MRKNGCGGFSDPRDEQYLEAAICDYSMKLRSSAQIFGIQGSPTAGDSVFRLFLLLLDLMLEGTKVNAAPLLFICELNRRFLLSEAKLKNILLGF
ncbi:unnamed protein product [Cuscuta campestris]|uniref:Uncharacterized protein n=1 Tax=Cuscuta campestris TaxID=132261 RepID=A0A484M1S5_9ASTE|nr:unnamed protein product [Cuscuta campestris]